MKRFLFVLLLTFFAFYLMMYVKAQEKNEPDPLMTKILGMDGLFHSLRSTMSLYPYCNLNDWITIQSNLAFLDSLASDSNTEERYIIKARYAQGYGYHLLGLYDFALQTQSLIIGKGDSTLQQGIYADMAKTSSVIQDFPNTVLYREKVLDFLDGKDKWIGYNNLALAYLDNKQFDKCIEYVHKIPMQMKYNHTRLFSARAYGFKGDYENARKELEESKKFVFKKSVEMFERLKKSDPKEFWEKEMNDYYDRGYPGRKVANEILADESAGYKKFKYSKYALVPWFREIYKIYPGYDEKVSLPYVPTEFKDLAQFSFINIKGLPLLSFKFESTKLNELLPKLKELKDSFTDDAGDKALHVIENNILYAALSDMSYIAVVAHTAEHAAKIREAYPDLSWTVTE